MCCRPLASFAITESLGWRDIPGDFPGLAAQKTHIFVGRVELGLRLDKGSFGGVAEGLSKDAGDAPPEIIMLSIAMVIFFYIREIGSWRKGCR